MYLDYVVSIKCKYKIITTRLDPLTMCINKRFVYCIPDPDTDIHSRSERLDPVQVQMLNQMIQMTTNQEVIIIWCVRRQNILSRGLIVTSYWDTHQSTSRWDNIICFNFLRWQVTILWRHWCSLFRTSVESGPWVSNQGGSIITCALLSLAHNDPQSQLWISKSRTCTNFTPWYSEATAGVTA